ncbi:MAG TPA: mechanosensitive ion channel [Ignavibacteriaceae bacterium]|nr:mechanosensitive ion channel [Ignavibacteriaceae bacterium]
MNYIFEYVRRFIHNDLLYQVIIALIIIIFSYLFAHLLSFLIKKIFKPIASRTATQLDDEILSLAGKSVFKVIIIAGSFFALSVFTQGFNLVSLDTNSKLIDEYPYLAKLVLILDYALFIVLVFVLLIISFRIVTIVFKWYSEKINANENKDLSGSFFPLLNKVSKILLSALALVVILAKFKIDISAFIVSLGVGSLAIALAAQETISNMISGFIIMIDRPFRIGDRIRIGTDILGDVVAIGIRSTKIMDFDRNITIVPNNDIVKSRIINLTYPNILTRVLVEVGVAYGSDIDKVKEVMLKCALENSLRSTDIMPEVNFMKFGDSSLDFRLDVKTDDYKDAFTLGCQLREAIYKAFEKEKIEIPFPQRVVYLKNESSTK